MWIYLRHLVDSIKSSVIAAMSWRIVLLEVLVVVYLQWVLPIAMDILIRTHLDRLWLYETLIDLRTVVNQVWTLLWPWYPLKKVVFIIQRLNVIGRASYLRVLNISSQSLHLILLLYQLQLPFKLSFPFIPSVFDRWQTF